MNFKRHPNKMICLVKIALCCLVLSDVAFGESGNLDKITISMKDASFESVLKEISKQAGLQYAFQEHWKFRARKVSIIIKDASLDDALRICFRDQPFTYAIVDRTIVVKEKIIAYGTKDSEILFDIEGYVHNEKGEALAGASIVSLVTSTGTFTDISGKFVLKKLGKNTVISVSYLGYKPEEIKIEDNRKISVVLNSADNTLDQVQIIGYGTVTHRLNIGSVSTIKAEELEKQPVTNPLLALEGRVPGVQIVQNNGISGSGVFIQIRGQNSLNNGNLPLYIIDGVPYGGLLLPNLTSVLTVSGGAGASAGVIGNGNPLSYLNPNDIESIEILKDADATAIYGSRGANGVVLITTKSGKANQSSFKINVQSGFGRVNNQLHLLNTREYLDMRYEAFKNDNATIKQADYDLTLWDTTRNTDWQKALLGGTAKYLDMQTSISGGTTNYQYLISGNYHRETTVFPGEFADQRGSFHFSMNNTALSNKFHNTFTLNYLIDDNRLPGEDLTREALQLAPDAPSLFHNDGSLNWALNNTGSSTWTNPLVYINNKVRSLTNNLIGNISVGYNILDHLEFKGSLGYTTRFAKESSTYPLEYYDPSTLTGNNLRLLQNVNNLMSSWVAEPQMTYSAKVRNSVFSILAGATLQENENSGQLLTGRGFASDLLLGDISNANSITVTPNGNAEYKYISIFSRINYNFRNKYLADFTGRRDGSSRFGPDRQLHSFGSVGLAWIFSEEELVKDNLNVLSFGKLRGSYGTTGSDQVGDYKFLDLYSSSSNSLPYQSIGSLGLAGLFSPDLGWEETKKLDAAIELGFFKDRILLTINYYKNLTFDQLLPYNLPSITGFTSINKNLDVPVENKGWEFSISCKNINQKRFAWSTTVNFSVNRNRLVSVVPGMSQSYQLLVGRPITTHFVFHYLGVDPITGQYQFADSHGSPTFLPNYTTDQSIAIDPSAKFFGGVMNSITFHSFSIDFLIQFERIPQASNYLFNAWPGYNSIGIYNQPSNVLSRWQKPGDVSNIQKFSQSNFDIGYSYSYASNSNLVYSNGSFLRLKNISITWNCPSDLVKKSGAKSVNLFIHAQNLLTITNYDGLDPENQGFGLPPLRVITFGLQISM